MILKEELSKLDLDRKLVKKLQDHEICIIQDLWKVKRSELKKMGLSDSEINQLMIKMQLQGLDFNQRVYKNE